MSLLAAATHATDNLVPIQMVTLGLLILAAHLGGKLFDRCGLSVATGQLLGGVLVGPWALQTIGLLPASVPYAEAVASFGFFIFIFVSLVVFSIGEELHLDRLRHVGRSTLLISPSMRKKPSNSSRNGSNSCPQTWDTALPSPMVDSWHWTIQSSSLPVIKKASSLAAWTTPPANSSF